MTDVKCINCRFALWSRTPSGRIKKNISGECCAAIPAPPVMLCAAPVRLYKGGIWPDYEGDCDSFLAKEQTS